MADYSCTYSMLVPCTAINLNSEDLLSTI